MSRHLNWAKRIVRMVALETRDIFKCSRCNQGALNPLHFLKTFIRSKTEVQEMTYTTLLEIRRQYLNTKDCHFEGDLRWHCSWSFWCIIRSIKWSTPNKHWCVLFKLWTCTSHPNERFEKGTKNSLPSLVPKILLKLNKELNQLVR